MKGTLVGGKGTPVWTSRSLGWVRLPGVHRPPGGGGGSHRPDRGSDVRQDHQGAHQSSGPGRPLVPTDTSPSPSTPPSPVRGGTPLRAEVTRRVLPAGPPGTRGRGTTSGGRGSSSVSVLSRGPLPRRRGPPEPPPSPGGRRLPPPSPSDTVDVVGADPTGLT